MFPMWIRFWAFGLLISIPSYARDWTPRLDGFRRDQSRLSSPLPAARYQLGPFGLKWQEAEAGQGLQLTIVDGEHADRVLWQSRPGYAFVLAASAQESIHQWRGSFTIQDKPKAPRCREQSVDRILPARDGKSLVLEGQLTGPRCQTAYRLHFSLVSPERLSFDLELTAGAKASGQPPLNRLFLNYSSSASERFFGFGEQFSHFNLKGRTVPILTTEQGHLRGLQPYTFLLNQISKGAAGSWSTTYAAVPMYISSQRRALFLKNSEYSAFDLEDAEQVEIRVWANRMEGEILRGDTPLDLVETYTEYAGRMPVPPRWFHQGAIVGMMGGSEAVRKVWNRLRAFNTPIGGFWIQDWQGKRMTEYGIRMWWNWELDRGLYPDWEQLLADFQAQGIRSLGYVNPFLSDVSTKPQFERNLFAEAKALGYLIKRPDGEPYEIDSGGFTGTLVDLSLPEAFAWYKEILKEQMVERGLSGWMADFGEAVPFDAIVADGPASRLHNRYPELWAKLNREVLEESTLAGDGAIFLRAGFTRSPRWAPMFWLGDQMTTWDEHDGLKSSITGLLSGGLAGFSINHGDIGGLIALQRKILGVPIVNFLRTRELLLRGIELSTFTSAFRNHEGNDPSGSHQIYSDDETMAFYAYFAKVFALLTDYRQTLFEEASSKGYPVARHMFLEFPEDPNIFEVSYQWMLGRDFLIAPVVDPGQQQKRVYFPQGTWIHAWTGDVYQLAEAGYQDIAAPLGQPAVFFRQGSMYGERFAAELKSLDRPKVTWR
jgi:alpha-glucosidase (family GH31 glycosyl hydrolase)